MQKCFITKTLIPEKAQKILAQQIPDTLIKSRKGSRGMKLRYISGNTAIGILNEAFNYVWSWSIEDQWIQESTPKFDSEKDAKPIPQKPVAHVRGTLTVPVADQDGNVYEIRKTCFGSKPIVGGQSEQESCFKAAATDALKKAASLFGIAAQLYRDEEEQAYFESFNYESPWTDEMIEKYEPERKYINNLSEKYNYDVNDLDELVRAWSGIIEASFDDLLPENITDFVNWLKEQEANITNNGAEVS